MQKRKTGNLDMVSKIFVKLPDDDQLELTRTAERLYGIQQSIDRKKEDAIVMEESGAGGNENRIV